MDILGFFWWASNIFCHYFDDEKKFNLSDKVIRIYTDEVKPNMPGVFFMFVLFINLKYACVAQIISLNLL